VGASSGSWRSRRGHEKLAPRRIEDGVNFNQEIVQLHLKGGLFPLNHHLTLMGNREILDAGHELESIERSRGGGEVKERDSKVHLKAQVKIFILYGIWKKRRKRAAVSKTKTNGWRKVVRLGHPKMD